MNLDSMMLNQNSSYNGLKHIEEEYFILFYTCFFHNIRLYYQMLTKNSLFKIEQSVHFL